ncbi:MAG: acyl-CoA dehydrogenase, partial [Desulfobacteraceae bacterium]|nr:acyl-CoA dehydrogenase [Desulfobacteraceae bacterium]
MLFKLTEEQQMIQDMVREFSRKVIAVTAEERDKTKEYPKQNFKKMGKLGLMGMMIPEEYGGENADTISYVLALSEIAYSCASTSVVMSVQNSIICESFNYFGTEEQKEKYLIPLAQGKMIGAFGLTEPEAGSDPVSQTTTAVKDGDHYIINGTKRFITSGETCKVALVTAKTDETTGHKGISVFIVPKGTKGFEVGHVEDKMGLRASDTTDLLFDNCRVPLKNMLGQEGDGFKMAMRGLDAGRIGIAAQSLGVAQAAFDAAVKYAKSRKQFGQSISKFQAIRFQIADMAVQIEAAKQLILSA